MGIESLKFPILFFLGSFRRIWKRYKIKLEYSSLPSNNNVKQSLYRPLGIQEVEFAGISIHSAHEGGKVVNPTHRPPLLLLPPPTAGNIPGTYFCYRLNRPQDNCEAWKNMSMENSSDTFGTPTRDLMTCGAASEQTTPLRTL